MPAPGRELVSPWLVLALLVLLTAARLVVNVVVDPLPLSGDEAQYWLYGEHLAGGYYSKPPLLPWLMRWSTDVFGAGHGAMRLPSLVLHPAIAFVLFLLGRELVDRSTGVVAALLYLTLPAVSLSSMLASTDPPMMLGWALASLALVLALRSEGLLPWALTGAAVGIGLLAKYTILAWVASAALILLLDPHWRRGVKARGLAVGLAAAVVVALPNLVWNAVHGFPTFRHLGENADLAGHAAVPLAERVAELGEFVLGQVGVFGPVPSVVLLVLVVRPATWRDPALRYVLGLGLPLLLAIGVQAWLNRANANWAAPAYLGFSVAVAAWLVAGARRRLLRVTLAMHLAVAALLVVAAWAHVPEPSRWSRSLDPFQKLRGVDQVGAALRPILADHPDAWLVMGDRMLMANVLESTGWPLERAIMWNADGRVSNHFEMVTAFPSDPFGPFLVVTTGRPPERMLARFATHERLLEREIATHSDARFTLRVDLARGFEGYAAP